MSYQILHLGEIFDLINFPSCVELFENHKYLYLFRLNLLSGIFRCLNQQEPCFYMTPGTLCSFYFITFKKYIKR